MNEFETTFQVNKFARRNRHLRTFSAARLLKMQMGGIASFTSASLKKLFGNKHIDTILNSGRHAVAVVRELMPIAPGKRLYLKASMVAVAAILVSSFNPSNISSSAYLAYETDYISAYDIPGDVLVADEDGYLLKVNPQTDESNRIGLTDFATHTVESGESLSVIAERYGVKVETIMWENGITNANSLRVGQAIMVPPVDGVSYKVASGDTVDKVAKKFGISSESIIAQNNIEDNIIAKGQALFLPNAEPIAPPQIVVSNSRNPAISRGDNRSSAAVSANPSTSAPAVGKMFIYPTMGKITNGYKAGHYALDIADRSKPAIWAAAGGTVVKASSGTWGGGYGNHIIIDHGNGVKTLYAHMSSLNVGEGQWVNQGDVVGIMGNTGRVYGATGIHLHWEVIINGVKVYPGDYY